MEGATAAGKNTVFPLTWKADLPTLPAQESVMDMVPLSAQARVSDKTSKQLRRDDTVPCVLYGNKMENTSLQCTHKLLLQAYRKAGESTLVELEIADGKKLPVLFHQVDLHPVSGNILHVDFFAVNMKKEIEAKVPVHWIGEAPAVKELGGVLVANIDHVTVRCLPVNLPHELTVDIGKIAEFGDAVTVADIQVPEGVIILEEPDQVIAAAQEPRQAEEEPATTAEDETETEGGDKKSEGEDGEKEGSETGEKGK